VGGTYLTLELSNKVEARGRSVADEDLSAVARVLGGDVEAFGDIVRRHERRMINIAYRITGNFEEACEVAQDAFVSAYGKLKSFKGASMFSTWLYSIVLNLSRNRLKKMKTRQSRETRSVDDPVPTAEGSVEAEPASDDPTALEELERKEVRRQVQGCIDALDVEFREVIVLRDVQGFQYDEIASMLGLAAGTVKSRISRARDSVRECLKKIMGVL